MKKKMNLKALKIESFITDFKEQESETVKGGLKVTRTLTVCPTANFECLSELEVMCELDPRRDR